MLGSGRNGGPEVCRDNVAFGIAGQVQDVVIRTLVADPVSGHEHAFGASFLSGNASCDRCPIGASRPSGLTVPCKHTELQPTRRRGSQTRWRVWRMLHYVIRDGHLVDRRRVRSPGLAIMIRPDLAERERRRGEPPNPMPLPSRKAGSPLPKSDGRSWARNPVAATANPAPNACDRNDGSPLPSASVAPQPAVEVEYFSHSPPSQGVWRQSAT